MNQLRKVRKADLDCSLLRTAQWIIQGDASVRTLLKPFPKHVKPVIAQVVDKLVA